MLTALLTLLIFFLADTLFYLFQCREVSTINLDANRATNKNPVRIYNLDDSLIMQKNLMKVFNPYIIDLTSTGKKIRMGCSTRKSSILNNVISKKLPSSKDYIPFVNLIGSNDYDHVTLNILKRLPFKYNLLFFDYHPDWIKDANSHIFCGTWVSKALDEKNLNPLIHVGGLSTEFDATGDLLENTLCFISRKKINKNIKNNRIKCIPANRYFSNKVINYSNAINKPLLTNDSCNDISKLLGNELDEIMKLPLFIAIDKDVLTEQDNYQAWESGVLKTKHIINVINDLRLNGVHIAGFSMCGEISNAKYDFIFSVGNIADKNFSLHGERKFTKDKHEINERTNIILIEYFKEIIGPR